MKAKIRILGQEYTLYIDEEALEKRCEELDFDAETTTGLHDSSARAIYVSPCQAPEEIVQTLLHEILHAIGDVAGHPTLSRSTSKNEALVNTIALGLTQALKEEAVFLTIQKMLWESASGDERDNKRSEIGRKYHNDSVRKAK